MEEERGSTEEENSAESSDSSEGEEAWGLWEKYEQIQMSRSIAEGRQSESAEVREKEVTGEDAAILTVQGMLTRETNRTKARKDGENREKTARGRLPEQSEERCEAVISRRCRRRTIPPRWEITTQVSRVKEEVPSTPDCSNEVREEGPIADGTASEGERERSGGEKYTLSQAARELWKDRRGGNDSIHAEEKVFAAAGALRIRVRST